MSASTEVRQLRPDESVPPAGGWQAVPLQAVLDALASGEAAGPVPELLRRTDGQALLYPGEVHSIAGEPESGKGWVALSEAAHVLTAGEHVLYLDFEDTAVNVAGRLLALDVEPATIAARLTYVQPHDTLADPALRALLAVNRYRLAVLDGMTEAYALLGLDSYANQDVPTFLRRLARPIAQTGAAVVLIDHVTKTKEGRGRFALGGGHKLAGVAVAYGAEVIDRPSRTRAGKVKLTLSKDRHGHIPGSRGGDVAVITITPEAGGERVTVAVDPPDSTDEAMGTFRPTVLMERVSAYIEANPGATRNQIREAVSGKATGKDTALQVLTAEGWIKRRKDGQAHRHHSVTPYRGEDAPTGNRVPESLPSPDRVPDPLGTNRVPGSPPYKGDPAPGPTTNHEDTDRVLTLEDHLTDSTQ